MFSVIDAMLLHPVDYVNPSQVMLLWERNAQGVQWRVSGGNFLDWRKQSKSFSDLAAWTNVRSGASGVGCVTAGSTLPLLSVNMMVWLDREDSPPRPAARQ